MNEKLKPLSTTELLEHLRKMNSFGLSKKRKFTPMEVALLEEIIIQKNYSRLPLYIADVIREKDFSGMRLINKPTERRLDFFFNFLNVQGNATTAAIKAGYSPKSAKQQGYRTLKYIQKQATKV